MTGPSVWYADQYRSSTDHVYTLTAEDITELDAAVAAILKSGKDIQVRQLSAMSTCTAACRCLFHGLNPPWMAITDC